jgi:hypothetical protein
MASTARDGAAIAAIYNLSFPILFPQGEVSGIRNYVLSRTSNWAGQPVVIDLAITNDSDGWENQHKLADYYSLENRQRRDFNPRYSLRTGFLSVDYSSDLAPETASAATNEINEDLELLALLWSLAQRRRVVIDPVSIAVQRAMPIPLLFAGDLVDTCGFNEPLIAPAHIWAFYDRFRIHSGYALQNLFLSNQMRRHLATFMTPYLDERIDALWKICESVGKRLMQVEPASDAMTAAKDAYKAAVVVGPVHREAKSLQLVGAALHRFGITPNWLELNSIRSLRNSLAHEFIYDKALNSEPWLQQYAFMDDMVERLLLSEVGAVALGSFSCPVRATVNGKAI